MAARIGKLQSKLVAINDNKGPHLDFVVKTAIQKENK